MLGVRARGRAVDGEVVQCCRSGNSRIVRGRCRLRDAPSSPACANQPTSSFGPWRTNGLARDGGWLANKRAPAGCCDGLDWDALPDYRRDDASTTGRVHAITKERSAVCCVGRAVVAGSQASSWLAGVRLVRVDCAAATACRPWTRYPPTPQARAVGCCGWWYHIL